MFSSIANKNQHRVILTDRNAAKLMPMSTVSATKATSQKSSRSFVATLLQALAAGGA